MKEKTEKLKQKIEKDYKDMMEVINRTSLPLFIEDTIEDMHILIETLIEENKELKEFKENIEKIDKKQLDKLYKDAQKALKEYRETQNKVAKLEEENARLKNKNSFDVYKMGQESQRRRIERDYIPKIKVREALKEEQERLKKGLGKFYNNDLGNSATRILQSLLGKE